MGEKKKKCPTSFCAHEQFVVLVCGRGHARDSNHGNRTPEISSVEADSHLNLIFPRKTSAGLICISFSVSAIVRSVMPIGVTQFNLCCSPVK